jgi:hypothetical protein
MGMLILKEIETKRFSFLFFLRTTPVAPPYPDQWQTATEHHHHPPESPERPISASSSDRNSNVDNLRDIIASIHQYSSEKIPPSFLREPILDSQIHSRPSTASRSQNESDSDDDNHLQTPTQQIVYATVKPQQHIHQESYADSFQSSSSSSTSRQSPIPSLQNNYQQRFNATPPHQQQQQQQDDKVAYRSPSVGSGSRKSSDRFPPPPPPNIETLDLTTKPRSISPVSNRSSTYAKINEVNIKPKF